MWELGWCGQSIVSVVPGWGCWNPSFNLPFYMNSRWMYYLKRNGKCIEAINIHELSPRPRPDVVWKGWVGWRGEEGDRLAGLKGWTRGDCFYISIFKFSAHLTISPPAGSWEWESVSQTSIMMRQLVTSPYNDKHFALSAWQGLKLNIQQRLEN